MAHVQVNFGKDWHKHTEGWLQGYLEARKGDNVASTGEINTGADLKGDQTTKSRTSFSRTSNLAARLQQGK